MQTTLGAHVPPCKGAITDIYPPGSRRQCFPVVNDFGHYDNSTPVVVCGEYQTQPVFVSHIEGFELGTRPGTLSAYRRSRACGRHGQAARWPRWPSAAPGLQGLGLRPDYSTSRSRSHLRRLRPVPARFARTGTSPAAGASGTKRAAFGLRRAARGLPVQHGASSPAPAPRLPYEILWVLMPRRAPDARSRNSKSWAPMGSAASLVESTKSPRWAPERRTRELEKFTIH
jgi:hypothetical protein